MYIMPAKEYDKKDITETINNCEMTTTIKTAFGEFRGKKGDAVTQYRGIKYASLKDQLAVPTMVEQYGSEVVDATKFG